MTITTRHRASRAQRATRTAVAAAALGAVLASVPGTAHAMRPGDTGAGAIRQVHVSTYYCATWQSTGDAWAYVGIRSC